MQNVALEIKTHALQSEAFVLNWSQNIGLDFWCFSFLLNQYMLYIYFLK